MRCWIDLVESQGFDAFEREWGDYVLDLLYNQDETITDSTLKRYYNRGLKDISLVISRTLYRGIHASREWLRLLEEGSVEHIGCCWSGDITIATEFMRRSSPDNITDERFREIDGEPLEVLFEATVQADSINVNRTIATNGTAGEDEVNVLPGAPIHVLRIFYDGEWHDWNRVQNA